MSRFALNPKVEKVIETLDEQVSLIPSGLKIATMTIICEFATDFNTMNIGRYTELSEFGITKAKYADPTQPINPIITRTIEPEKPNPRKKPKKIPKIFYNQSSLYIYVGNQGKKRRCVNLKIFQNGSVHITGCKSVLDFGIVIQKLCTELSKTKAIVHRRKFCEVQMKPFADQMTVLENFEVLNPRIAMINSTYHLDYRIDRERLYNILCSKKMECSYEPCVHACVNIKYNHMDRKKISIFIFESGAMIITGAKNGNQISKAYYYIIELLDRYRHAIIKYDPSKYIEAAKAKEKSTSTETQSLLGLLKQRGSQVTGWD